MKSLAAVLGVLFVGIWMISDDGPFPIAGPGFHAAKEAKCKADLQCWAGKQIVGAGAACQAHIEKLAKFSVRWTDTGTFEQKFDRFRWLDRDQGTVTFVGGKAEFQNGFGAYQPMVYECDMSSDFKNVLAVRVREGRLPP